MPDNPTDPVLTIEIYRDGSLEMKLSHGDEVPKEALQKVPEILEDAAERLRKQL